jgi:glycosyltransferase involved in cell wall biosynthesis
MDKKSRILYLRATSMSGAGTRVLVQWLNWLDRNGFGVFVSAPNKGWLKGKLSQFPNKKVLDAEFYIPKARDYPKFSVLVLRLSFFVIKNRIDVIHCNSDVAYFTACVVARITRRPVVTHLRFHYKKEFYSWLFGGWRKPDLVILVSEAFRQEEIEKIHAVAPGTPVKALHNCIDVSEYPKNTTPGQWDSDYIFYPAAISERKRQIQLFRMDQILQKKRTELRFIVAGKATDSQYWKLCMQEADRYPGNHIEFVGHVNDVASMYRGAFLSLTLSEYETFGYSVLESMASGVPVIGYRIDAVQEVLGESTYLVDLDDIETLTEQIVTLRQDSDQCQAYSERLRQRARDYFSPDYICPKLLNMYAEVLERRRA